MLPSLHHFRRGGRLLFPGLSMTIDILISQGQIQALSWNSATEPTKNGALTNEKDGIQPTKMKS